MRRVAARRLIADQLESIRLTRIAILGFVIPLLGLVVCVQARVASKPWWLGLVSTTAWIVVGVGGWLLILKLSY
jgi:hypothetical protein